MENLLKNKSRKLDHYQNERHDEASIPFIDEKNISDQSQMAEIVLIENENKNELDFKHEIKEIFKDIDNLKYTDEEIIENIDRLIYMNSSLKKKLQITKSGYDNISLLHAAARVCRGKVCAYLIDIINIDKNVRSKSKLTPMHIIVKSNSLQNETASTRVLISTRMSVKSVAKSREFQKKAVKFKETFQILLARDCDCNLQDELGYTALHYAIMKNNIEVVSTIINLPSIQLNLEDEKRLTPVGLACKLGAYEILGLLVDKVSVNEFFIQHQSPETQPFHMLCKNKEERPELVGKILNKIKATSMFYLTELLQRMDHNRQTILQICIENSHSKTTELLLKEYYNDEEIREDRNGNLPIHYAAKVADTEILSVLIRNDAFSLKTNGNYETALHVAASHNRFKFINEFLAHEKSLVVKKDSYFLKDYEPSVRCINRYGLTPMFISLMAGNLKCVEALLDAEDLDLEAKDPLGNSIYHTCAEHNNFEALRVFLTKKDLRFEEPLFIRNNAENSVVHVACMHGNLEIIKIIVSKIFEGFSSLETYITAKNSEGNNCFHIACLKDHFNIVEYFLRDLKINYFLDQTDSEYNTPLHQAALHGHLRIVDILLMHGADLNMKNKDGDTALELSCRKGFFDISKTLIMHHTSIQSIDSLSGPSTERRGENPLHIACHEGAHEVVELLLSKGAQIDVLNRENKNCLDIAISQRHPEVVRVLLNDQNWQRLILTSTNDRGDLNVNVTNLAFKKLILRFKSSGKKENPQIVAMFEKKMWESIKLVLDKSRNGNEYDFSKLDPDCQNIQKHPLMLMARSGQETLLKHETTQMLLNLKWRIIPRLMFYINLFLYLLFVILFSVYSMDLKNIGENENNINNIRNTYGFVENSVITDENLILRNFLIVIILLNSSKKLFQFILVDGLSFVSSAQNMGECASFSLAFLAVFSPSIETRLNLSSIAVLISFIVFSFQIQKLKIFGLYVLAFKRTIQNSTKFFPIFFLIYTGFTLSFTIRTFFGVSYFNVTTGLSMVRTLSMALGDLSNEEMGLDTNLTLNYIIYFMFIGLVCIITFNLFVGIAVGEIKTVLDEADIQQISMRIIFVLKVQNTLNHFNQIKWLKFLSIRFDKYNYDHDEFKYIKTKDRILKFFRQNFFAAENIKLVDPVKRLEDNLFELSRTTNNGLKATRDLITSQLNDVETKLSNSQQRLEGCLIEMSRKTKNNFESTEEATGNRLEGVKSNFTDSQNQIINIIQELDKLTNKKMDEFRQTYDQQINSFKAQINENKAQIVNHVTNVVNEQMTNLNIIISRMFDRLNSLQIELDEAKRGQNTLIDLNKKLDSQLTSFIIDQDVKAIMDKIVDNLLQDDEADLSEDFENISNSGNANNDDNDNGNDE